MNVWNKDLSGVDLEWFVSGLFPCCFLFLASHCGPFESLAVSHLSEDGARRQFIIKVNSVSSSFCVTLNGSTARSFYFLHY